MLLDDIYWGRPKLAPARERPSTPVWVALTLGAAVATGTLLGRGELKFALLPCAVVLLFFFAGVPSAGYVALLWSVGTAVDMLALPEIGVSSLKFVPAEILLWLALAALAFMPRELRRALSGVARRRESVVLAIFLLAVVGGVAVGVANGASVHAATFDMRLMLFYAAFWPALAALIWNRALVFRLVAAGVIVVVALQVAQVIVGPSTRLFLIAASDLNSSLSSDGTGFLRVRPPGLTTVYVVAGFALARVLWGPARHRLAAGGVAAVALTGVVLSLNRNMLLGLALGLCATALVARPRHRFVVTVAVLGLVLAGFALFAQSSSVGSDPVVSRIASIANYSGLKQQTLDDRYYENRIAMQRIRSHPVGGLGWGPDYGAVLLSSDDGFLVSTPRSFMHEQYLWIWMRAGILGLLSLVAILAFGIWNGARWCRARHGTDDAWLGAGVVVSVVAVAASSNVAIYLTPPDSTVPLVTVLALAALMRHDLARS
ncbi:MAG TPA: O-antigen ligase family protein [Thermoleophilaceae bacterium]